MRSSEGRTLVIVGEPGIGKTSLLEYAAGEAPDFQFAHAVGVESEMELAFSALHQLCAPMLESLERLPAPQRDALAIAFRLSAGAAPDRLLVGLAVIGLLSEVAADRPLLCVVDDAQWVDQASAQTLAIVGRRMSAESVAFLFATRGPSEELERLPTLRLGGLDGDGARQLLQSVASGPLDERVRERIIAETHGNPLALLELPRGSTAVQLAGGFGMVEASSALSRRIEESFVQRIEALSEDTRRFLLIASAEPLGDSLVLWRAAEKLGIDPAAGEAAEADGLLAIDHRVTFRHPLVRSAVYGSASVDDRRAVHLALAEVTDPQADPDRRAWHLAAATAGPDEQVAAELERSAARAQACGGVAAAAAFLKRSVSLTLDPGRRAERALAAAQAHLQAGAFDAALRLLASADAGSLDELGRARMDLLRGQITFAASTGGEAPALLLTAARQLEALDPQLARETYLDAWAAAHFAGQFARAGTAYEVARAALAAPQPTSASSASDLLLDGLSVLVSEGRDAAAPKLSRAVSAFAEGRIAMKEGFRWGFLAASAAYTLWDHESWQKILVRQVQTARDTGLLVNLTIYLHALSTSAAWCGDFGAASSLLAEADVIADATGTQLSRAAALILASSRGKEAEASALIEVEVRNASAAGQGLGIQTCAWVSAILYNGLGRYEQALAEARRASEEAPERWVAAWALPELIEAATRTGDPLLAVEALERLVEAASIGGSDWGLGVLARSRALLSNGKDADALYREAIDRLTRTERRPELARGHLLYGEWLRRENRRLDARAQLRTAYGLFTTIGMEAFAERARSELAATGEHVRRHTVETRDDLTAQERQIAELARDGLSNPEIGARLFLSPRTVEWHLRHVFIKLGIRSRRELAKALPGARS